MIRAVPVGPSHAEQKFFECDPWRDKTLSQINGDIKRMGKEQIREKLKEVKLDTKGVKDVMIKRLKNHYKKIFLNQRCPKRLKREHFSCDYFVGLDFEATCQKINGDDYPHEIIEFPAIIVEIATGRTVAEFQSFVRPRINTVLSDFCIELTGITQNQVDTAPYFPVVFKQFQQWLCEYGLLEQDDRERIRLPADGPSWTFVTDGMADICRFLYLQCAQSNIPFPFNWASRYCNIKKIFQNAYKPKIKVKIEDMLEILGLKFEGRLHSGIDDARNICRITYNVISDGNDIWQNEELKGGRHVNLPPPREIADRINELKRMHHENATLCKAFAAHNI